MFQSNHYLFDLPDYSENLKPGASELPTTTHNSPGSFKSQSLTFEDSPFDCSFDEGSQSGHAQAIWNASVKYLQSALKQFVDTAKGFNDQSLYNFVNENEILNEESVEQMIMRNSNLKIQQKHEFIGDLQNQGELMDLMKQLSALFNQNVFHEITYVIFKIWEKKAQNQKNTTKTTKNEDFIIPQFDCFWGFEQEELPKVSYSPLFEQKNIDDVVEAAEKCSEEIGEEIYFDKKIKLLNLRDIKKESEDQLKVAYLFSEFFKALTKSIFLSAEGFFTQPTEEQNVCEEFNEDLDFQMNSICALEQLQEGQNRFVRSFSFSLEDDDEDEEFSSSGNKKRKSQ